MKSNPSQLTKKRKLPEWAIGLIIIGVLIIGVSILAFAMSQYWCEPCKVIKTVGGK